MVDHNNPWNAFIDRFKTQIHRDGGRNNIIPMVKQSFRNLVNMGIDALTLVTGLQNSARHMADVMTDAELEKLNQDILTLRDEYNDFIQNMQLEDESNETFTGRETLAAKSGTAASDQTRAKAWFEKSQEDRNAAVRSRNKQKTDAAAEKEKAIDSAEKQYSEEAAKITSYENDKLKKLTGV